MKARTFGLALAAAALIIGTAAAQSPSASDLYFEALRQQENKGDLTKAIETYKSIIDRYPADPIVPKALLELATCYETTRQPEAATVYARIVRDFGTSSAAATARTRLARLDQKTPAISTREIWEEAADWVSPDGKYLSFIDWETGDLATRELPSGRVRRLTNNGKWNGDFADAPVPSKDGKSILYSWFTEKSGTYDLRVVSRDGGAHRVLVANVQGTALRPVGWLSDGKRVVYLKLSNVIEGTTRTPVADVYVVGIEGGQAAIAKRIDRRIDRISGAARLSPKGDFLAYEIPTAVGKPERDIHILSLADGSTSTFAPHLANDRVLDWYPSGDRILFVSDRGGKAELWSGPVTNGRGQGEPTMVRSDAGSIWPTGFTTKGDFYYGLTKQDSGIRVATLDSAGKHSGQMMRLQGRYQTGQTQAAWSPDGSQIAYVQTTKFDSVRPARGGQEAAKRLAVQTLATGDVRLYDLGMLNMQRPSWSADGKMIYLQGNTGQDGQGAYRVDLVTGQLSAIGTRGGGNPVNEPQRQWPAVLPDGRSLLLYRASSVLVDGTPARYELVLRDLVARTERVIIADLSNFALSADGRWIAVRQRTAKDGRMVIMPAIGGEGRTILENTKGEPIAPMTWSPDGRFIYMFRLGDSGRDLWRVPVDGSAPTDTGIRVDGVVNGISVNRDGRIAISSDQMSTSTWVMTGLVK